MNRFDAISPQTSPPKKFAHCCFFIVNLRRYFAVFSLEPPVRSTPKKYTNTPDIDV